MTPDKEKTVESKSIKPKTKRKPRPIQKETISAVAQFVSLMHARDKGDLGKVRGAQIELTRLGVNVDFVVPQEPMCDTDRIKELESSIRYCKRSIERMFSMIQIMIAQRQKDGP